MALGFLPEIYALRRAFDSINQRYFDGQQTLFPTVAEGLEQLLALVEKTVGIYKENLAGEIERLESLLNETRDEERACPLAIDLAALTDDVQGAAKGQVAYLVDMAKADALDLIGETRQASEIVDRHVYGSHAVHEPRSKG